MNTSKYISLLLCIVVCAAVGASVYARGFGVIKNDAPTVQTQAVTASGEAETLTTEKASEEIIEESDAVVKTTAVTASTTTAAASTAKKAESTSKTESTTAKEKGSTKASTTKAEETTKKSKKKSRKKNKKRKKKKEKNTTTTTTTTTQPAQKKSIVTLTIDCSAATPYSPYALNGYQCSLKDGDTVYDILERSCRLNGIEMRAKETIYGKYVYSINHISEDSYGENKGGWMYKVNGKVPMKSADKYELGKEDTVEFYYIRMN